VADYILDVRFDPADARLDGTAAILFRADEFPLASTTFYLHGELQVESLHVDDRALEFTQKPVIYEYDYSLVATEVSFDLSGLQADERLTVEYSGYCNPSKARSESDYMRIDATGVFLRSYAYSLWFPIFMAPRQDEYFVDLSSVTLSTPAEFPAVLTGRRVSDRIEGGRRVSIWQAENVSVFAAQCSARRWDMMGDDTVQVLHLTDDVSRKRAESILAFARQAIDFYSSNYGPGTGAATSYIMQLPKYGDISSGNVSGISDESWLEFNGDWFSKYLLAHELVHPYTGRQISRDDPMWCFVVEGFPSYFHLPFLSEALGADWYRRRIRTVQERYLQKRRTGLSRRGDPLPPEKPIDQIGADELSTWKDIFVLNDRVILFWDFLRRRMGEHDFGVLCRDLFGQPQLTARSIQKIILSAYPGPEDDVLAWLSTTEFPDWMQLEPDDEN
jgi:hypothetical protein